MKITILAYLEAEDAKSYDEVVDQVAAALRKNEHQVSIVPGESGLSHDPDQHPPAEPERTDHDEHGERSRALVLRPPAPVTSCG